MGLGLQRKSTLRTYFVPNRLVSKRARGRLAEKDDPPLTALRQFEAFVVYLMGKFSCWGNNYCSHTLPCTGILCFLAGLGITEIGKYWQKIRERLSCPCWGNGSNIPGLRSRVRHGDQAS